MADSGYVAVRAKRALLSNDRRQLIVLEGTMGGLIAVEGLVNRPRFRVVFATAIMLSQDTPRPDAQPAAVDRRHDGSLADLGARPVLMQQWAEILVGADDIVLDPVLDVVAAKTLPSSWPPALLSGMLDELSIANIANQGPATAR